MESLALYLQPVYKIIIVIHLGIFNPELPDGKILSAYELRYNKPDIMSCLENARAIVSEYNSTHMLTYAHGYCEESFDNRDI